MPSARRLLAAPLLALALAGGAGCSDDDAEDTPAAARTTPGSATSPAPAATTPDQPAATTPGGSSGGSSTTAPPPSSEGRPATRAEAAAVTDAMVGYSTAFAEGDYEELCDRMSSGARETFLEAAREGGLQGDCPAAVRSGVEGELSDEELAAVRKLFSGIRVSNVIVNGDRASANIRLNGETGAGQPYAALREDGVWKVVQNPGQ